MTLNIPDEISQLTGHNERDLLIDLACALYDQDKLTIKQAREFCGLERGQFEDALVSRKLPIYRYTEEMLKQDMAALEKMRTADVKK